MCPYTTSSSLSLRRTCSVPRLLVDDFYHDWSFVCSLPPCSSPFYYGIKFIISCGVWQRTICGICAEFMPTRRSGEIKWQTDKNVINNLSRRTLFLNNNSSWKCKSLLWVFYNKSSSRPLTWSQVLLILMYYRREVGRLEIPRPTIHNLFLISLPVITVSQFKKWQTYLRWSWKRYADGKLLFILM